MENLRLKITELETSLKDLKSLIDNQKKDNRTSNLIVSCCAIFAIVSIFTFTEWISAASIAFLFAYTVFNKNSSHRQIEHEVRKISDIFNIINSVLNSLDIDTIMSKAAECKAKDDTINFLNTTISRLKALLEQKETSPEVSKSEEQEESAFEINMMELLKKIQKLDIEVEDFGNECASYMRKEFNKTLRVCGFEFVDYSYENDKLYATEEAEINNIDCTARAIVTVSVPHQIVLKGHAFIPKTN